MDVFSRWKSWAMLIPETRRPNAICADLTRPHGTWCLAFVAEKRERWQSGEYVGYMWRERFKRGG